MLWLALLTKSLFFLFLAVLDILKSDLTPPKINMFQVFVQTSNHPSQDLKAQTKFYDYEYEAASMYMLCTVVPFIHIQYLL